MKLSTCLDDFMQNAYTIKERMNFVYVLHIIYPTIVVALENSEWLISLKTSIYLGAYNVVMAWIRVEQKINDLSATDLLSFVKYVCFILLTIFNYISMYILFDIDFLFSLYFYLPSLSIQFPLTKMGKQMIFKVRYLFAA